MEAWSCQAGISLLLAATFGFFSLYGHPDLKLPEHSQGNVQLPDDLKNALISYLSVHPTSPNGAPGSFDATVKLDQKLEDELHDYLQKLSTSRSGWFWGVLLIIVLLAAAAAVWLAAKGKPEAALLTATGATLTATAAILGKLIEAAPLPVSEDYSWLSRSMCTILFLGGICLLWVGTSRLLGAAAPKNEEEKSVSIKEEALLPWAALLLFGFSLILLAVVPLLLVRQGEPQTPNAQPCPSPPTAPPCKASREMRILPLKPVNDLGDGRQRWEGKFVDPVKVSQLTAELRDNGASDGDTLLLFGSTDCIPPKPKGRWKSNQQLAEARAEWIRVAIPTASGIKLQPFALPQHTRCNVMPDLRSVHPYLIHFEKVQ